MPPKIDVTWTDITNINTLTVDYGADLAQLRNLPKFDTNDVITALEQLIEYFSVFEDQEFVNERLPIIDRSLGDLLGVGEKFKGAGAIVPNESRGHAPGVGRGTGRQG